MFKRLLLPLLLAASGLHAQTLPNYSAQVLAGHPVAVVDFNDATSAFVEHVNGVAMIPSSTGTITPRLAGYDASNPHNYAASFGYNSYVKLPTGQAAVGTFEWTHPFSVQFQLNNFTAPSSGSRTLAFKGDANGGYYNAQGWEVQLQGGNNICLVLHLQGGFQNAGISYCFDGLINGYNYNVVMTHDGTGNPNTGTVVYVNGLPNNLQNDVFDNFHTEGMVSIAVAGGTGYADSTPFTVTGGGANCTVTGEMISSGGVPASIQFDSVSGLNAHTNYGCTSAPTVVLTAPTGTGVTLTATANAASMANSAVPLYLFGDYVSGYGDVGYGSSGDTPIVVDEFAVYPNVATQELIQSTWIHTKFFSTIISPAPANPPIVIWSDDGCNDTDNLASLNMAVALHKRGYIKLVAIADTANDGTSEAFYRQVMDSAGLAHIPVAVPSAFEGPLIESPPGYCGPPLSAYNASTSTSMSAYPSTTTVFRKILANLPSGKKIVYLNGGGFQDLSEFMQSTADSISSQTGLQLWTAGVTAAYFQGLGMGWTCTAICDNSMQFWQAGQYVMANNGTVPLYWFGGTPYQTGPWAAAHATDPYKLLFAGQPSLEFRIGWDSLPVMNFITTLFQGTGATGTATITDANDLAVTSTPNSLHTFFPLSAAATTNLFTWFANSLDGTIMQSAPRGGS